MRSWIWLGFVLALVACGEITVERPPDVVTPTTCNVDDDCDDGLTCTTNVCQNGQCVLDVVDGRCYIGGKCYSDGATSPDDDCLTCSSARSTLEWTNTCTTNDVIDSDGDCVPTQEQGCHDGDVWSFDSCGNPHTLVTECPNGCADGACSSLLPPTIESPESGDEVANPIYVSGVGHPNASFHIEVLAGTMLLGQADGTMDGTGQFSAEVGYAVQPAGTGLTISATQTTAAGTSSPANVAVLQAPPPPAPSVHLPKDGASVFGLIRVKGTALPGASVHMALEVPGEPEQSSEQSAEPSGAFERLLEYPTGALTDGDELVLTVTQVTEIGTSMPTTVGLLHQSEAVVGGTIAQLDGFDDGVVYVRAYHSPDEVLHHVAEVVAAAVPDSPHIAGFEFSMTLPKGEYFFRAFRDYGSLYEPNQGDGEPTVTLDAQSVAVGPVDLADIGAAESPVHLDLTMPSYTSWFEELNAYTEHESHEPYAPGYWNEITNQFIEGKGKCGGFYLRLEARRTDSAMMPNPPMASVSLPSGQIRELRDDGGCHGDVIDNTAKSYDTYPDDGHQSLGFPEPGEALIGEYTFFYRTPVDGGSHIHLQRDAMDQLLKLDRKMATTPNGQVANTSLTPSFSWIPVAGAGAYQVSLHSMGTDVYANDSESMQVVPGPPYTPPTPLVDDQAYMLRLTAFDSDPSDLADFDARSWGTENNFVTDVAGDSSCVITGSITNTSSVTSVPMNVGFEQSGVGWLSNAWLSASAKSYQLTTLRVTDGAETWLGLFLDVDGSGDRDSEANSETRRSLPVNCTGPTATVDIVLTDPVVLIAPQHGAQNVGVTPTFEWQAYATPPAGDWCYAVLLGPQGVGMEGVSIWAVPNDTTSLDMSQIDSLIDANLAADVTHVLSCADNGGTMDAATGQCSVSAKHALKVLSATDEWMWLVAVSQCPYDPADLAPAYECVVTLATTMPYAVSTEWDFNTGGP